MPTKELLALKARLSKELSAPDDKTNPEAFVDPGKTKVQTGTKDSLDTTSSEGSLYNTVTKPSEGKNMSTVKKEEATEMIPMGGKPVGSKPSVVQGPKAEEHREEHDVPSVARGSIPQGGGVEPEIHPPKLEEEDDEMKAKQFEARALKLLGKASILREEEDDDDETKKAKKETTKPSKFAPLADEYRSKQEEVDKVRMKLEAARAKLEEEMGQVQSALSGQPEPVSQEENGDGTNAMSSAGTPPAGVGAPSAASDQTMQPSEEGQPHGSQPMSAPSPAGQTTRTPQFLAEEEEDDETKKALKAKGRELFTALKAVEDAIGQAGDMAGNVSPNPKATGGIPQPEAKIPAQPGKSGSSEVYREEKGAKPNLDLTSTSVNSDDSGGNPKKLTQNAQGSDPKDVSGVYPKPTELFSGVGYTGETVGKGKKESKPSTKVEKIGDLRPSYKELGRDRRLPMLKFMVSEHIPTTDEVEDLANKGELMTELTKEYHATTDKTLPEGQESLLRKGLRLINGV